MLPRSILIFLFNIPYILYAVGQGLPSPGIYFTKIIQDASIEGISQDSNETIYLTTNQASNDNSTEAWAYKLNSKRDTVRSVRISSGKVGACSLTSDETILVVSPFRADSNLGIQGISTQSLNIIWSNSVARQSIKGVAPLIVPQAQGGGSDCIIVYYSLQDGIVVMDPAGRMLWAATNVKTANIVVTEDSLYAINQSPGLGYPVTIYALKTGRFQESSRPVEEGGTNNGIFVSPDQQYIYTFRTGENRGLFRHHAGLLVLSADIVTDQLVDATKFKPLLSSDGTIVYVTNSLNAVMEAYSIREDRTLWRTTLCPTIPSILSRDGSSMYSFTCGGDLVRLDAVTSDYIWRFKFPDGFVPSFMELSKDGTRLLVAGTVAMNGETGYAYAFWTEEDQATVPGEEPAPVKAPATKTEAPSVQKSETISSGRSALPVSSLQAVLIFCVIMVF